MKKSIITLLTAFAVMISLSMPVYAAENENEYEDFNGSSTDSVDTTKNAQVICNVDGSWSVRIPKKVYLTVGSDGIARGEYTISVKGIINEGSSITCAPKNGYTSYGYQYSTVTLTNDKGQEIGVTVDQPYGEFYLNSSVSASEYTEGHAGKSRPYNVYVPYGSLESNYDTFKGTENGYLITETGTLTSKGVVGIGHWSGTLTFEVRYSG